MDSANDSGRLRDSDLRDETGPMWCVSPVGSQVIRRRVARPWMRHFRSCSQDGGQKRRRNFPPELDLNPPAELLRNNSYYTDDDGSPEGLGHGGYVDGGIYPPRLCLWQQPSLWDSGIRNDDSMIIQRLNHRLTIYWHIDDMDSPSPAVCYD